MNVTLLNRIGELVRDTCGLVVDPARRDVLVGLVEARCQRLSLAGPAEYLRRISVDRAELQELIEGLTIGEMYLARIPIGLQRRSSEVMGRVAARLEARRS